MRPSLTIIMPAYEEAQNLKGAYEATVRVLKRTGIYDYEILIGTLLRPDGGHDGTPLIAEQIAKEDSRVRHIHNNIYVGLGFKYRQCVKLARKDYIMMIPGDGEFVEESLDNILVHIGKAEIIIPYHANPGARGYKRRLVSKGFTILCNILFGMKLKYYNGLCVLPRRYLQAVPMSSDNFAYIAEILIYLVKSGVNYIEVPWLIRPSIGSNAFNLKSVIDALGTLALLFWNIHFKRIRIKLG